MRKFIVSAFSALLVAGVVLVFSASTAEASGWALADYEGGTTCIQASGNECEGNVE